MTQSNEQELFASGIVGRVLGIPVDIWDTSGRQGAYDLMAQHPDGRTAAIEVTSVAEEGRHQLTSLLDGHDYQWRNPGRWVWSATIGDPRDYPRLRQSFDSIVLTCEAMRITRPDKYVMRGLPVDDDLRWLVEESSVSLSADPGLPLLRENGESRPAYIMPRGGGGGSDTTLVGLNAALESVYARQHVTKRIRKVASADTDERHLYLDLDLTALPFPVMDGLWVGETVPISPPNLPEGITHIWLVPRVGKRVLVGSGNGWVRQFPFDD